MGINKAVLIFVFFLGVFDLCAQDYDVKWKYTHNCSYNPSTNVVTKSGSNNWCSAHGISRNYLLGGQDGYLDYRITGITSTNQCFIGFKTYNETNCAYIDYSFHQQGANYKIYENYVSKYTHNSLLQVGDTVRIERSGSNVYYWHIRNGTHTLKYTSTATVDPNDTLYVDFALYYNNSSLGISTASFGYMDKSASITHVDYSNDQCFGEVDLTVDSAAGPITYSWSNGMTSEDVTGLPGGEYTVGMIDTLYGEDSLVVDVQYLIKWDTLRGFSYNETTNTLTKNVSNSWCNAGATSFNRLLDGEDGWVEYTISNISHQYHFGLAEYNEDACWNPLLQFSLHQQGANFKVYESGSYKYGNNGAFQVGDIARVERSGSNIYYWHIRDGVKTLEYTSLSTIDPNDTLYADVCLYYNGSSIIAPRASFGKGCSTALSYAVPNSEVDGSIYNASLDDFYVRLPSDYETNLNSCTINIYDESTTSDYSLTSPPTEVIGKNFLSIDLSNTTTAISSGVYLMEFINSKGDKLYLKFRI